MAKVSPTYQSVFRKAEDLNVRFFQAKSDTSVHDPGIQMRYPNAAHLCYLVTLAQCNGLPEVSDPKAPLLPGPYCDQQAALYKTFSMYSGPYILFGSNQHQMLERYAQARRDLIRQLQYLRTAPKDVTTPVRVIRELYESKLN